MRPLRSNFKLAFCLLIGSSVLAYTYAAYDVEVGHLWGTMQLAAGLDKRSAVAKQTIVVAGNELSIDGDTKTIRHLGPEELAKRLAWARTTIKGGPVTFRGQTLDNVVAEFNRYDARKLITVDDAIRQLRIGGTYRLEDIDSFLNALAITHGVKATVLPAHGKKPQVIVLTGEKPGTL